MRPREASSASISGAERKEKDEDFGYGVHEAARRGMGFLLSQYRSS
jgi:hypothetical protein